MTHKRFRTVKFTDFWSGFAHGRSRRKFFQPLLDALNLSEVSENPDILFFGCFSGEHNKAQYNPCVKILFSMEPFSFRQHIGKYIPSVWDTPQRLLHRYSSKIELNPRDLANMYSRKLGKRYLAVTHAYINHSSHYRLPIPLGMSGFDYSPKFTDQDGLRTHLTHKDKFCMFMVSEHDERNSFMRHRVEFFRRLSEYKRVDSYGGHLNNMGRRMPYNFDEEQDIMRHYKFCIAMENSVEAGFYTYRMTNPMLTKTLPIFRGDPKINQDFHTKSFISFTDFDDDIDKVLAKVIELDQDNAQYQTMCAQPYFMNNTLPQNFLREPFYTWVDKKLHAVIR